MPSCRLSASGGFDAASGGDAVAAGEPAADGARVGGLVGESVELELHEHQEPSRRALFGQQEFVTRPRVI